MDLTFHRLGYDLLIKHTGNDLVILKDHFYSNNNVETLEFSDNTSVLLTEVLKIDILGTDGNDMINGSPGAISENIEGGKGNDTINGRGGNDFVNGGDGDDIYIYNHQSKLNSTDVFNGQRGLDSVHLYFTNGFTMDIADELLSYYAFLQNPANIDVNASTGATFSFTEFGLELSRVEEMKFFLHGQEQTIQVVAKNDTFDSSMDQQVYGNVLSNNGNGLDTGGIFTVKAEAGTFTTVQGGEIVISENGSFVYTPPVGFSGTDSYEYTSTIGHGVSDQATVEFVIRSEIHGTSGSETIYGTSGNDYIFAGSGNDIIYGGDGDDVIYGEWGNDTLIGGLGQDMLYGGYGGADTFVFEAASAFNDIDVIGDFFIYDNDAIDISDLLTGYTPGVSDINDFVSIVDSGSNSLLYVDRDGTGSTYSSTQIATIQYNNGLDVDTLLANNNLIAV